MSNCTRRQFIRAVVGSSVLAPALVKAKQNRRPNIIFILADDLGYGDLSCYGRPDYQTPHLDRLAKKGVRFLNAYSASPVCTPTRCAFITGRYPARTRIGLEEPLLERRALGEKVLALGLPAQHPTIATLLKQKGYKTALIGKWHLGYLPNFGPVQSGFDEFFGVMSGAVDFFTHKDMRGDLDFYEGKVPIERIGYVTELLTERAIDYLSRRRKGRSNQPFYLSLHYTAPHWPWEGPNDERISRTLGLGYDNFVSGGSLKTYAAMMKSLDDGIGAVLEALKRSGWARDTLVIFTSDNGGERFSYNWPFTGSKFSLWEGGLRVPAIVSWPGTIGEGQVSEQAAITMDWTATIIAAAQAKPDPAYPLDGIDLLPITRNPRQAPQMRTFFWRNSNQSAVLKGQWKYLNDGTEQYLFDLSTDQRERANQRELNPAMFEQLKNEFSAWELTVLPRPRVRER
jgi:arylsulfatase A-like enzyme